MPRKTEVATETSREAQWARGQDLGDIKPGDFERFQAAGVKRHGAGVWYLANKAISERPLCGLDIVENKEAVTLAVLRVLDAVMPRDAVLRLPANNDQPYSTLSSITHLCEFAEMQLGPGNYDGEHWEQLQCAAKVVRAVLDGKPQPDPFRAALATESPCEMERMETK